MTLDIDIDGHFNSIRRTSDGTIIATRIVEWPGLSSRQITSVSAWQFRWQQEAEMSDRRVFAICGGRSPVVHGMISLQEMSDHVFVHLIESAPHNRGPQRMFEGVAANLMGFACVRSQELGLEASVAFDAKTQLIGHYQKTLGARPVGKSSRMIISPSMGLKLIEQTHSRSDQWPA